jgi:hypothetical protein
MSTAPTCRHNKPERGLGCTKCAADYAAAEVARADDRSALFGFLSVPFAGLGFVLYILLGLPIAGIICGWLIARDRIMGEDLDDSP